MIERLLGQFKGKGMVTYRFGGASCVVYTSGFHDRPNVHYIASVYTWREQRGQGYAKCMMRHVCEDADRAGVTLTLSPVADEEYNALTQERLELFYASFGFHYSTRLSFATTGYPGYWVRVPLTSLQTSV